MILTHMIDTNKMLKLTIGQGRNVKGQGQICKFVKNFFRLYIMNQRLNTDYTYTHDRHYLDVEVDLRSRSQDKRSRSKIQVKKNVLTVLRENKH